MKIKALTLMLIAMGIMIAGFSVLVYGLITKIGNATMMRGAIYSIVYVLIILVFGYAYLKAKKFDTVLEIKKDSIEIVQAKNA